MKILFASLFALGLSFAPVSAQCNSGGCGSKAQSSCQTSKASVTKAESCSTKQDCGDKKSCGSKCGDTVSKTSMTSNKVSFAKKLAKMSAKERKHVVEAMTYLTKTCPVGSRMGTTMKTLDELYSGSIANLKNAHASGKLGDAEKAQVAKAIAMLSQAQQVNAQSLNGFALVAGAPKAQKSDCDDGSCSEGSCSEGSCGDGESKKDCSDSECVGCAGSCGDKAVATTDCTASIAYSKRLCASWAKANKEVKKLDAATAAKLKAAVDVVAPLGMIESSMQGFQKQMSLVRSAVKTMPCSSKVGCPGTAKIVDNGGAALASAYALLKSMPVQGAEAKKAECSDSSECGETKTECSESKSCGEVKTVRQ
jgi:hypothetical protein